MPFLPGYKIIVKRNGTTVQATNVSFTKESGEVGGTWQITLARPIEILTTDTWSYSVGIGGATWVRFKNVKAIAYGEEAQVGPRLTDTIKGKINNQFTDLTEYCLPKTYVFVNPTWAKSTFGDVAINSQGVLVTRGVALGAGIGTIPEHRCYHSRLPGKQFEDGSFQCVLSCYTHHDMVQWLAQELGIELFVNTPDVDIRDTSTINSGTTIFEALKRNFTFWNPDIRVEDLANNKCKVSILDIRNPLSQPLSSQSINIAASAVESISLEEMSLLLNTKDHVIITGRAPITTTIDVSSPNLTPVKIPEIQTPINQVVTSDIPFDDILALKTMDEYSGVFGAGDDAFTVTHLNRQVTSTGYHAKMNRAGDTVRLPVIVMHEQYDTQGIIVGKTVTLNTYGEGDRVIKTIEREYNYCAVPGSTQNYLMHTGSKITQQNYVIESIGMAITTEVREELVVYDEIVSGAKTIKDNPNPFAGYRRMDKSRAVIDKTPTTPQRLMSMTTHYRLTYISRTDDNTLEKRDFDFDVLSGTYVVNSQVLQNPKPVGNRSIKDEEYRKEYTRYLGKSFGGIRCRKPPITVSHEDITNDTIAEKIKDRVFFKYSVDRNKTLNVKVKVPIPVYEPGATITLGNVSALIDGTSVTITGGEYRLRGFSESASASIGGINYDLNLKIQTRF